MDNERICVDSLLSDRSNSTNLCHTQVHVQAQSYTPPSQLASRRPGGNQPLAGPDPSVRVKDERAAIMCSEAPPPSHSRNIH